MLKLPLVSSALCLLFGAHLATAHFVWLERTPEGPAAFFGEWADDVRETQDGYLKIITAPRGVTAAGEAQAAEVQHGRILLPAGDQDRRFTAHYRPEQGDNLVRYHARLGRSETTGVLTLELVPTAPEANTLRVLFQGQPLPGAEVTLFTSEGWSRTFTANAQGIVQILTPWPGECVLEVMHLDKTPGELDGRPYQAVRHVSTLMFTARANS